MDDKVSELQINQAVTAEKIARLAQDMEAISRAVADISKAVADISILLSASKGSVKTLIFIGSACAALGSAVAELIHVWR